jgi:hypothetical protein
MPKELITFGSRVTACDCLMVGRVNMVWRVPPTSGLCPPSSVYYRVQFPPRSPFIGDWAVYRTGELALLIDRVKLTNINIVAIMRPKFPRFQT